MQHQHASFGQNDPYHNHPQYYDSQDEYQEGDLLGEYPDDEYQDDENEEQVDSEGEPLPTADQVRDIINSIPSYRFEEKQVEKTEKLPDIKKKEAESYTER